MLPRGKPTYDSVGALAAAWFGRPEKAVVSVFGPRAAKRLPVPDRSKVTIEVYEKLQRMNLRLPNAVAYKVMRVMCKESLEAQRDPAALRNEPLYNKARVELLLYKVFREFEKKLKEPTT